MLKNDEGFVILDIFFALAGVAAILVGLFLLVLIGMMVVM